MSRFPLFQRPIPMFGRQRIFERIIANLLKPTPQHISLVGPRFSGKSVVLGALAEKMRSEAAFDFVLEWDLGHQTPESDDDFLHLFREKLAAALLPGEAEYADYLQSAGAGYEELREVIDALGKNGKKVLALWDGFDRPLRAGQLTRNLWDNLLELCRQEAFLVVTASRRKLQELIQDGKSATSDFWQVFEVVRLPPFDPDDLAAFASALPDHSFESGAMTELANWSGGIPPVLACLLNRLVEAKSSGVITNGDVNRIVAEPDEKLSDILQHLWSDCSGPAADLFRVLAHQSECAVAPAGKAERDALVEMGLARKDGKKLYCGCRLMQRHVADQGQGASVLGRLFGEWADYRRNIRGILERRIAQIDRFDERLIHMVERAIEEIPNHPGICLGNLSHIEDRAFDLIWERELDRERVLPQEAVNYWTVAPRISHRFVKSRMEADDWTMPEERSEQLAALQYLTGSHYDFKKATARYVSKDVYVLMNALHCFRNRSQHSGGQVIGLEIAISGVMLCTELVACLARDLNRRETSEIRE